MGRATCKRLIEKGYLVFGIDRSEYEHTDGLHFFRADLTLRGEVEAAYAAIAAQTDGLDGIIHMAGVYDLDSLIEMDEMRFVRVFDVNLFGVYRVNAVFTPLLKKNARIVITSSELAPLHPLPFTGVYAVSKTALEQYAFSLRMELALNGYSVSLIRPGAVKTGLLTASTNALREFCEKTERYVCNAERFRKIVDSVETKNISPDVIARIAEKAISQRRPKYIYNVNRNFALRLLSSLPARLQVKLISRLLRPKQKKE